MLRIKRLAGTMAVAATLTGVVTLMALKGQVIPAAPTVAAAKPQMFDHASFITQVKPFFDKYCIGCHTAGGSEKDVTFDAFKDQETLTKGIPNLEKAVTMLRLQKMPPKGETQPTDVERKSAINWLETFTSGCDCNNPATLNPGRVTLRRLNRSEYNNTIRDLLAIDSRPADAFPVDDAGYGFDNIGDVLSIAPVLMEKYMTAAEAVMHQAILVDPIKPAPVMHWDANSAEGSIPKTPVAANNRGGRGGNGGDVGNGRIFYYDAEIHAEYNFPADGTYVLRVRGYSAVGTNARGRPQVQFSVDGKPFGKPLTVNGDQRLTKDFATTPARITAGKHVISLALINNGTKAEYDAAVEKAKNVPAAPTTQAATQGNPAASAPTSQPAVAAAGNGQRGRGGQPAAGARGAQGAGAQGAAARGRGPAVPPAPPSPTGRATLGVFSFEAEGPTEPTPDRMPESYRRVMVATPSATVTKPQAAEQIIRNFATLAFRRPVKDAELQRLVGLWKSFDADGDKFEESISSTLSVVLASPNFLYQMEHDPTPAEGPVRTIDEYELAARLSYFLWSSMPDAELSSLAQQGKLRANLDAQVTRMLNDPKAHALVENFGGQWLQLRMMDAVTPDAKLYPDFDPALRAAMITETQMFFEAIMREDRSILDFIDADFTFVNERLARHYGIAGIKGDAFQRVKVDPTQRGGLLTQGSILTITSLATRTSPVLRGKWVLQNILDAAPPPPPPNIPALAEQGPLTGTVRERMVQHRQNATCAACHEQMDAIGFGMENFDGIGKWRMKDADAPIDATGVLPGGMHFNGPAELKQIIKGQDEAFCRALTTKLMTYAVGRGMEKSDRCYIDPIVASMAKNGDKFTVLVREIVHSDPFQKRSAK